MIMSLGVCYGILLDYLRFGYEIADIFILGFLLLIAVIAISWVLIIYNYKVEDSYTQATIYFIIIICVVLYFLFFVRGPHFHELIQWRVK
jgi:hypothetical protein